ncbi:MAG: DUF4342 domain-containing protein [Anaerolineae bacterium]
MSDEEVRTEEAPQTEEPKAEGGARTQEFKVTGDAVVGKLKELLHEGNVRRVIIKNEEGKTLIEIPLTLGVAGALLLPVWAAIGAIAALAANLTIVIEKIDA